MSCYVFLDYIKFKSLLTYLEGSLPDVHALSANTTISTFLGIFFKSMLVLKNKTKSCVWLQCLGDGALWHVLKEELSLASESSESSVTAAHHRETLNLTSSCVKEF